MTSRSSLTLVADNKTSEKLIQSLSEAFPKQEPSLKRIQESSPLGINIELSPRVQGHSRPQENYYRKWERAFAMYCGATQDEMHEEILCEAFGSQTHKTKFGDKRRPNKRSAKLNPKEYSHLIDTLIVVAAGMGYAIPPPPTPEEYEDYAHG